MNKFNKIFRITGIIFFVLFYISITGFAQGIEPTETEALINLKVINKNNEPRKGETITFISTKTKREIRIVSNEEGKADFLIPKGDTYKVRYLLLNKLQDYKETVDIPASKSLFTLDLSLQYDYTVREFNFENVNFDTGKAALRPESTKELNQLTEYLVNKTKVRIGIYGHTDNVGNDEANLKLSQARAASVKAYLVKKGIAEDRIETEGFGENRPVADNATEAGRKKNRRTEVKLLGGEE